MASIRDFGLKEIVENHLPEWITGYACAGCSGRYEYKCPAGYKRTECRPEAIGSHGCCPRCLVAFVKCVQEGVTPPPPVEGETRELDLGDYEVTWTLSGNDTLKVEITVTDTGVTCHSVTGGACYSATPPGVTISTFTVTGHLKSAVAPPTEGYLTVTTSPTGALVMVDGVSCGTTPVTRCALSLGAHQLTITKSGYETVKRGIGIAAGEMDMGTITLTPTGAPPVGEMTRSEFLTELQNRGEIDVSKLSTTSGPNKWYLYRNIAHYSGGGYGIEIHALGYKNPPPDISFIKFLGARGYVNTLPREWTLARINELPFVGVAPPTRGYLSVNTSPTGATVTVDGVSCGTTPVTACELSTGTKTVKITKSGYNTVTRSVTITAGATTNLGTIALTPTGVPPTGFNDWVASKGGKDAITGGNINELTDAYIGLEDVGFSVTGADVNKVTDYYLGLG